MILTSYAVTGIFLPAIFQIDGRHDQQGSAMAEKEWDIVFDDDFQTEFDVYEAAVQDKILARAGLLRQFGPNLPRPCADTLEGSKFANMKELRAPVGKQVWAHSLCLRPQSSGDPVMCRQQRGRQQEVL
jgi:hypothetical protein